jgi:optic atrophy 3 protein
MGNKYHYYDTLITRKFMKIQTDSDMFIKALNDDVAVEKGIEFFYEIIFYSIVIGLPLYEMYRASAESKAKADELESRLKHIEALVIYNYQLIIILQSS